MKEVPENCCKCSDRWKTPMFATIEHTCSIRDDGGDQVLFVQSKSAPAPTCIVTPDWCPKRKNK